MKQILMIALLAGIASAQTPKTEGRTPETMSVCWQMDGNCEVVYEINDDGSIKVREGWTAEQIALLWQWQSWQMMAYQITSYNYPNGEGDKIKKEWLTKADKFRKRLMELRGVKEKVTVILQ